eukprot:CAMPEP_0119308622 /NCGR_PEP_ID=MMETSP1333-20130426/11573_1 /TAXON_ID=418940 /ORGANISM="Scyphosphaera apsteinii, Strain RCC1455" /LENGTH=154 /DNA_ID=CAMNT_0007312439 /DNA_START=34 /DNA_END=498 /DNA_ORIENTATION=+
MKGIMMLWLALAGHVSALRVTGAPGVVQRASSQPKPQLSMTRLVANSAAAVSLAFVLSSANPAITAAGMPSPTMVEQYGSALIADDDDLRPAQQKFLEERAKMKTQYESQVESTFKTQDETKDKKGIYTSVVSGLILVSFVAPMITYFYYTGGK